MSYMDNLSQGYQNTYGGGYTQMYRKQPQTQIGGSQIKAPMRISLDRMYGGMPTAPPGPPTAPTFPIDIPEDYTPSAGYDDYDQYLQDQGWIQVRHPQSQEWILLPEPTAEGMVYGDWVVQNGEWSLSPGSMPDIPGEANEDLYGDYQNWLSDMGESGVIEVSEWPYEKFLQLMLEDLYRNPDYHPDIEERSATLIAELARLGIGVNIEYPSYGEPPDEMASSTPTITYGPVEEMGGDGLVIQRWQDQLSNLMEQFAAGEIDYLDENGNLDVTALRGMGNVMSDWLADVLETSYETGIIQSDFYDEEGNLVPELESMATFFESTPQALEAWNQYNKRLAMHAISQGQSVESAYYTETTANAVAAYGAQIADQVIPLLQNEMKMQYDYIVNSFKNALDEAAADYNTEDFVNRMNDAYNAIQKQYEMGLEQLAAQISEQQSGVMGSIFSGALSFIVNMALTLF